MGWLYGVPATNRSLMIWTRYMYLPKRSSMAWIGTPAPSDQVLAQSKWPTVKDLYEHRLLMLAHDCFFFLTFYPFLLWSCFTKRECNYNLQRKLTFLLPKPNNEVRKSTNVIKPYLYWILLTIIRVQSQAKLYLKTPLSAKLHANSLFYRYIF